MKINGSPLGIYKIVYASKPLGLAEAATELKRRLSEQFNIELECVCDNISEINKYEILIGSTNRDNSIAHLMSYKILVKESKLLLLCGGALSAFSAVDALTEMLSGNSELDLAEGTHSEKELLSLEKEYLTENSDLRVMTSNILAERWLCGNRPSVTVRAEIYAALLVKYSPDIIGVQETDMPWVELFPYYLAILKDEHGIDYEWNQYFIDDVANLTSIIYKKSRFSLVECSMQEFSYFKHTKYKLRVLTWAVLKDNTADVTYALINTHWSGNKENSVLEIQEENALIKALEAKYEDIRIFCTGDFNMHGNNAFEPLKEATGLIDAKEDAQCLGTLINENPGIREGIYIDHVFFNGKVNTTRYETVDNKFAHVLSDHLPQYGDFKNK